MDTEPDNQATTTQTPTKTTLRKRIADRWSAMSGRLQLIATLAAGLLVFAIGIGGGLAAGHEDGGEHGDRGGHERFDARHHDDDDQQGGDQNDDDTTATPSAAPTTASVAPPAATTIAPAP